MTKIDERTSVPLVWVATILCFMFTVGAAGIWKMAFWCSHVDDSMTNFGLRLARMEQAQHLEPMPDEAGSDNPNPFMNQAEAWGRRINSADRPQRKRR